jgi:tetratricopeptide (TPR) repeat protein
MRLRSLLSSAQLEEHIELLRKFRDRASGEWRSFWEAQILLAEGKEQEALNILDAFRGEESEELRSSAQLAIGDAYEDMERWEEAVRAYREAEKLPVHSFTAEARRVLGEARQGAIEPAERFLSRDVSGLSENDLMMVDWVAADYVARFGRNELRERARKVIEGLLRQKPDRSSLLYLRDLLDERRD